MFGNAPRAVWEKWTKPDELGRIELACRSFLVQWNDLNILIETGIGSFFEPKMADRFGVQNPDQHLLTEELARIGLKPVDIHYVILSHLHFDHAGGLLPTYEDIEKNGAQLVFPNAKFIVGEEAWERALRPHPRDKASFIPGLTDLLKNSGRLHILHSGEEFPAPLNEKFEYIVSNGHTPGQILTLIKGESNRAIFTGDLVPGSHWVHVPITMGYDRFPEAVIDEKVSLYDKAVPAQWILLFTHDEGLAGARLARDPKGKFICSERFPRFDSFQMP